MDYQMLEIENCCEGACAQPTPEKFKNKFRSFLTKNLRQMMFLDSPMTKLSRKDGIVSLMHCQERIFQYESYDMSHRI